MSDGGLSPKAELQYIDAVTETSVAIHRYTGKFYRCGLEHVRRGYRNQIQHALTYVVGATDSIIAHCRP